MSLYSPLGTKAAAALLLPLLPEGAEATLRNHFHDPDLTCGERYQGVSTAVFHRTAAAIPPLVMAQWGNNASRMDDDNIRAQQQLDNWSSTATNGILKQAPVTINDMIDLVAMSAVLIKEQWVFPTSEGKSFTMRCPSIFVEVNQTDTALRVTAPLTNNHWLVMTHHDDGPEMAASTGGLGWLPITKDSKYATPTTITDEQYPVLVGLHAFTETATIDLNEADPMLMEILGKELPVMEAKQGIQFVLDHRGIEAAATTAIAIRLGAAPPRHHLTGLYVDLNSLGYVFALYSEDSDIPLVTGRRPVHG